MRSVSGISHHLPQIVMTIAATAITMIGQTTVIMPPYQRDPLTTCPLLPQPSSRREMAQQPQRTANRSDWGQNNARYHDQSPNDGDRRIIETVAEPLRVSSEESETQSEDNPRDNKRRHWNHLLTCRTIRRIGQVTMPNITISPIPTHVQPEPFMSHLLLFGLGADQLE